MRFALTLILSLLVAAFGVLPALSKPHRHSPKSQETNAISQRQHRAPRAIVDLCLYIDASVIAKSGLLGLPLALLTDIKICLCLSALPLFLQTDIRIKALVNILGEDAVSALLTALINNAPGSQQCTYPSHATALCQKGDPCAFQCAPPFSKLGRSCICPAPMSECNGVCGNFPRGCSSALPAPHQARSSYALKDAQATCSNDETVCGVYGSSGFECVNTSSTLESCGGCAVSNPFYPSQPTSVKGTDCTSIEGVDTVDCSAGRCAVTKCKAGFKISSKADSCAPTKGPSAEDEASSATPVKVFGNAHDLYRNMDWKRHSVETVETGASQPTSTSSMEPEYSVDLIMAHGKVEQLYRNMDWKRTASPYRNVDWKRSQKLSRVDSD